MSTPHHIKQLERQRQALIGELLRVEQMIRGNFSIAHRRCGTSTCWCAATEGHPVNRVTWSEHGKSRTKAIPAEDIEWARQHTETYQRFRKNRQALRELERRINAALDAFEEKRVQKTRRLRKYL